MITPEAKLEVITLDGPAGCGKTTNSRAASEALTDLGNVGLESAGRCFRSITASVQEEFGPDADMYADPQKLDECIETVLELPQTFDASYWDNLDSPAVEGLVSVVGSRPIAQTAGERWYTLVTQAAIDKGLDLLVIEGRNPRDRIQSFIDEGKVISALDLMILCDPRIAAARVYRRAHPEVHDASEIPEDILDDMTIKLVLRRNRDLMREVNPFRHPTYSLTFQQGRDLAEGITDRARYHAASSRLPLTINFDTSHMKLEPMKDAVRALARSAVRK